MNHIFRRWLYRQRPFQYLRAAWLTILIWKSPLHPDYDANDANEPDACVGLKLAWKVSRDIWLGDA